MAENLEIKMKVNSHADFLHKLELTGAQNKGILVQKDIYYKVNEKLIKLRIQNGGNELIKYTRDEKSKNRFSDYEVLHLKDENPEGFFQGIFSIECIVNKKRDLWIYENTRIHLDTVETLGKFLELETVVLSGKRDAKQSFDKIVQLLDLDTEKQIRASYRDIILKKRKI